LPDDDEDEVTTEGPTEDRLWLIQCKREQKLPPKKLQSHLSEIEPTNLYGVVLAAPCDFSKASRDVLQQWCSRNGIAEWHVWGKAELEDMLFQPKNDHLLFAYFGISLQIRKRSIRTDVRLLITIKRKLKRGLEKRGFNLPVILRDPTDDRYPYSDRSKPLEERDHRWRVCTAGALSPTTTRRCQRRPSYPISLLAVPQPARRPVKGERSEVANPRTHPSDSQAESG
jgi:hypothetical protein